jgi:hypothetical protein
MMGEPSGLSRREARIREENHSGKRRVVNVEPLVANFEHPSSANETAKATHGRLKKTTIEVPPYSPFATPRSFGCCASPGGGRDGAPIATAPNEDAPFPTPGSLAGGVSTIARMGPALLRRFLGRRFKVADELARVPAAADEKALLRPWPQTTPSAEDRFSRFPPVHGGRS